MNISELVKKRYSTKAFDPSKKIAVADIEQLCDALNYSPSSVNGQPWHFFVAASEQGKNQIAQATEKEYSYNTSKIKNASHVVVMCARATLDEQHLANLLNQDSQSGRFANEEAKAVQMKTRSMFVNIHRQDRLDENTWLERQIYLALGGLLFSAAALNIDSCPLEGFDSSILDTTLGLADKGLHSVVLVALGYRSSEDFNAKLPKSRLPSEQVITLL